MSSRQTEGHWYRYFSGVASGILIMEAVLQALAIAGAPVGALMWGGETLVLSTQERTATIGAFGVSVVSLATVLLLQFRPAARMVRAANFVLLGVFVVISTTNIFVAGIWELILQVAAALCIALCMAVSLALTRPSRTN